MKLRYKLISAVILTMATTSSAFADEANAGKIHFTGELIEPSCVIEGDTDTDSTVPLGTYPTSLFNEGNVGTESPLKPFTIVLKNCPVATTGLPQVQLTFQGTHALTGSPAYWMSARLPPRLKTLAAVTQLPPVWVLPFHLRVQIRHC